MRIPRHLWRDRWLHLARMVPRKLRYWCFVASFAEATTGQYGNTECTSVTAMEVFRRIDI